MKKFSVSVTAEPLKETVRVEVPRAIVYDESNGVLKLDGNHPQIARIREIVDECASLTIDDDKEGAKRDALLDELKSLTSETEATAVLYYECDARKAKAEARDKAAAKKWLSELKEQEQEIEELPVWCDASSVVCQIFKITQEEMGKCNVYDPLCVALSRVFCYGFLSGQKAVTP